MSRTPFSPRLGPAKRTIFVVVCIVFYFLVLLVFHLSVCALVGRRQRKRTTAGTGVWLAVAGRTDFNSGYESDQSSHVGGARIYTRDTPYRLRFREVEDAMSDNELLENETLIDGQDAGAARQKKKRAKSSDRHRQIASGEEVLQGSSAFFTPATDRRQTQPEMDLQITMTQTMQTMFQGMWEMQLKVDEQREERRQRERREKEERDAQEMREWKQTAEETTHLQREKDATAATRLAQLELDRLHALTEQSEADEQRRVADNLRRKNERLLYPMREKDDLETDIKGLEHTLIQCQVDEEEWLFYLTANMTGKYATLVQGRPRSIGCRR